MKIQKFLLFLIVFCCFIGQSPQCLIAQEEVSTSDAESKLPEFNKFAPDATPIIGLLSFYQKKEKLYAEISSSQLKVDYIIIISIAKGIGEAPLLGGWSWDFGEDMIWQFRKVEDRIQIVRRNFRYQANSGTPEAKAVEIAFSDSILFSLPIVARGPKGGDIVELTSIFMSDLPQISSRGLPGFSFARDRSTWAKVKGLTDNMELQVAATYSGFGRGNQYETIMDPRGVSINVHYSISKLPQSGYQSRLADERVGYFNTVIKNFSKNAEDGNFVRYINRWNLQKLESGSDVSLPKKPIVFWLEKSVPYSYRKPIRDGILEWNRAFEEAGFYNAIEVRQQEDNDTWDPEDINYNTIRWSTANAGFAIGPSRINPLTGEIIDADIILDVAFIQGWNRAFEVYSPDDLSKQLLISPAFAEVFEQRKKSDETLIASAMSPPINETLYYSQQMGVATTFFDTLTTDGVMLSFDPDDPSDNGNSPKEDSDDADKKEDEKKDDKGDEKKDGEGEKKPGKSYEEEIKKLIQQGIASLTTHEVGHTLGLRHNFKQSTLHTLEEINDRPENAKYGYLGSIMEYQPVNIMPKGRKQGDYYATKLGEYDFWVINYGYRTFNGGTDSELGDLKKLATQQTKPALNYATDEDCDNSGDPMIVRFDLGNSPLEYAKMRIELIDQILPTLCQRVVKDGESYSKAMSRFRMIMSAHTQAMSMAANYIGGMHVHRDFKGDENARPPFAVVSAAQQREALAFLNKEMFGINSYRIPNELYNYLAPNRWYHWGSRIPDRYDLDVHANILNTQKLFLESFLSQWTISSIADAAYRVGNEDELFTLSEMVGALNASIFDELLIPDHKGDERHPAITSIRRNLQRAWCDLLIQKMLGDTQGGTLDLGILLVYSRGSSVPINDLARLQLEGISTLIQHAITTNDRFDIYSMSHLRELRVRIEKALNATTQTKL